MNLLLVDDHALFREGLRALLGQISPDVVVHEAATVAAAIDECASTPFRMVLLDLGLFHSGGMDTLTQFRSAVTDVPVIVLSGETQASMIRQVIEGGAVGFIPKSHSSERMIAALRFVVAGGVYLPKELLDSERTPEQVQSSLERERFQQLSPRQMQVARGILQGKTNKVIARELGLSIGTVKAHTHTIYQIIGARNRLDAVLLAAKHGFTVM